MAPRLAISLMLLVMLIATSLVGAAESNILVDHRPTRRGGPAADTEFINMVGAPSWQQEADDFSLSSPSAIATITAWGFYDQDNPPVIETMRIRFYDSRPGDGFPGNVLYEQEFSSFSREATGHIVADHDGLREYFYTFDLPAPVVLDAATPYWIELVQIGDVSTAFRWEASSGGDRSRVFINPFFPDWTPAGGADLAFQLFALPEPASFVLVSISLLPVVAARPRSACRLVKDSLSREWRNRPR